MGGKWRPEEGRPGPGMSSERSEIGEKLHFAGTGSGVRCCEVKRVQFEEHAARAWWVYQSARRGGAPNPAS